MPEKKTKLLISFLSIVVLVTTVSFVSMILVTNMNNKTFLNKSIEIREEINKEEIYMFLRKDIKENNEKISELNKFIIQPNGVVEFMNDLEKAALNNGLKYEVKSASLEPIAGEKFTNIESIRIQMNMIGEWENVEYFLELLENYPLKLNIKNVSFNKFSDYVINGKKVSQWLGSVDFTVVKIKDK